MAFRLSSHILLCALTLFCVVPRSASAKVAKPSDDFVVVLDAGHGGKDYGCVGDFANEKTITLDVARRVASMIRSECPGTRVVLTRDDDTFISLQNRADIANRANADLFISIHVNSIDRKTKGRRNVTGASVYIVGPDKDEKSLGVAMRENAVMELEDDYSVKYSGFDPSSAESYIIFELNNHMHNKLSLEFAELVQNQLVSYAGRADKGVRQAGFWVLWTTSMPSVLVELDFICNPDAERFLDSENGRRRCAEAIFNAFKSYRNNHARN